MSLALSNGIVMLEQGSIDSVIAVQPFKINEPRREKTGLRDFRPGPTQTGLYSLRSRLEP